MDRYARAKLRQRLQALEKEIAELEEGETIAVETLGDPDTYTKDDANDVLKAWNERLRHIQTRLPEAYAEWEEAGRML